MRVKYIKAPKAIARMIAIISSISMNNGTNIMRKSKVSHIRLLFH
jgi:hypothetical protein